VQRDATLEIYSDPSATSVTATTQVLPPCGYIVRMTVPLSTFDTAFATSYTAVTNTAAARSCLPASDQCTGGAFNFMGCVPAVGSDATIANGYFEYFGGQTGSFITLEGYKAKCPTGTSSQQCLDAYPQHAQLYSDPKYNFVVMARRGTAVSPNDWWAWSWGVTSVDLGFAVEPTYAACQVASGSLPCVDYPSELCGGNVNFDSVVTNQWSSGVFAVYNRTQTCYTTKDTTCACD